MPKQIVLRNLHTPKAADVKEDIEWLCSSIGLTGRRGTDEIAVRILHNVMKRIAESGSTTTERIAEELGLAVQRVNYHLRSFIESGILYRERKQLYLRQGSVKAAVEEMRKDANRIFDHMAGIGKEIDDALGIKNRS